MKNWILLVVVWIPFLAFSQDYYSKYEELMSQGMLEKVPPLLELWIEAAPKDENAYITGFNHYLIISKQENRIHPVSTDDVEESSLVQSEVIYNDSLFNISQDFIQKGILQHPKRLDLHFGKIHALWIKGEHQKQTGEILGLIDLGDKIKQNWLWNGNRPLENAKKTFTSAIYRYVAQLFSSDQYTYVQQISERMIQSFPKEVANYSNLGAVYKVQGNYKKAIRCFRKALKINPKDIIVLNNIAETYHFMDKPKKAIQFYQTMIEHGNAQEQQFARDKIQGINAIK